MPRGVGWAGAGVGVGWGAPSSHSCARAGPGAEAHHRLPAGQQQRSCLVASHAQEEWRGGEEEDAPPRLKSQVDSLPWRPSDHFSLDFMAWLFWDLPQHSLVGPGGGHEAAAARVT